MVQLIRLRVEILHDPVCSTTIIPRASVNEVMQDTYRAKHSGYDAKTLPGILTPLQQN